jgi:TetR/AcrR family transcriptional repressor of nem operon
MRSTREPGPERVRLGVETHLDACVRSRGVKAMLLDVRSEPAIAEQVRANAAAFATLITADLAALELPQSPAAARLFIAMIQEVALAELAAGGPDPALRQALWGFLGQASDHPSGRS